MKKTHITGFTLFAVMLWLTCVRIPSISLAPEERTNLFAGLLFGVAILAVVAWKYLKQEIRGWSSGATISLVLTGLCITSGLLSDFNPSDTYRATVLIISILSGYWIARLCFSQNLNLRLLMFLFLPALVGVLALTFSSLITAGVKQHSWGTNPHSIDDTLILLSTIPFLMLVLGGRRTKKIGKGLLSATLVVILMSKVRAMIFIPPISLAIIFMLGGKKFKKTLMFISCVLIILPSAYIASDEIRTRTILQYESLYYRAENYTFSTHIVQKEPLFGIGLRSPRDSYMVDYSPWYPGVDKVVFNWTLQRVVTSENIFLTMAVGCGLPFTILYIAIVGNLLWRLLLLFRSNDSMQQRLSLAFLFPITCCLIHSLLYDSFLQPEVAFLFHFFLGLYPAIHTIPPEKEAVHEQPPSSIEEGGQPGII